MSNLAIKSILGFIIFTLTLLGGLAPLLWKNTSRSSRYYVFSGEYFSRGIFFGGGLIHMLPDAQVKFNVAVPDAHYPFVMAICAFTIYALQFIEQGLTKLLRLESDNAHSWSTYMLAMLISIHSIILGATLGVEEDIPSVMIVFFAIIAHKIAESFALGINLKSSFLPHQRTFHIMFLFAFMTPIGILLGSALQSFLKENTGHIIEGLFQSVAAGTFLYIATLNHIHVNDHQGTISKLMKIQSLGLGIVLMAILALWI